MTDIYINDRKSRKGCMGLVIVLVILAMAAGVYLLQQRRGQDPESVADNGGKTVPELAAADEKRPTEDRAKPLSDDPRPELLDKGRELKQQGNLREAREIFFEVLEESSSRTVVNEAEELLGEIHIMLTFSPRPMPEKVEYTVQPGDTLGALARRFNTTIELIRESNRLQGTMIRTGDRMRILQGEFMIEVSKSRNDLALYLNDRFFKRYPVGTGEYERTPEGEFKITERIPQPTWWSPEGRVIPYGHEDNVLGTHWLSIDVPGYGLHGTWEPETVGYQSSAGCVRLHNDDIKELYTLVPVGTKVIIHE